MTVIAQVLLLCLSIPCAVIADEVITVDSRGKELRRTGKITDVKGDRLTLQSTSGRETKLALDRVTSFQADWIPSHVEADSRYAACDFAAAKALYMKAFQAEPRRWVKRKLLSRVIWCQRNTQQLGEACNNFSRLIADDPESPYFAAIPLQWQMQPCPSDVAKVVQDWMGSGNAPALRLMAASWLMTDQRDASISQLRELGKHPSKQISTLAVAQLWRAEMLTLKESRIAWWQQQVDSMPSELRAGPYYLLGNCLARFDRSDEAALAYLRVPTGYADDVLLSQKSLSQAAGVLVATGHSQEAIKLYRQSIELDDASAEGQLASAKLAELTK